MDETRPFALLFPGQGTEALGMSEGWETNEAWSRTMEEAEAICGYPLRRWMAEGPLETLKVQRHAPCAVVAHSVALYRAHRAAGMPLPALATGHSLGFYSAVVAAGVVPLEGALALVKAVEDVCEARFGRGTHGMAFFIGLGEMEIRNALVGHPDLVLSNLNGTAQFTVSGPLDLLDALLATLAPQALKCGLLPVRHPLHGDHITPLLPELLRRLASIHPAEAAFPILSHGDARLLTGGQEIWDEALVSVARPVWWPGVVKALKPRVEAAYECGSGQQLANLCRWADRELKVASLQDPAQMAAWRGPLDGDLASRTEMA